MVSSRMERLMAATDSVGSVCESTNPAAKFTSDGSAIAAAINALIGCSFVRRALVENARGNGDWLELDDIADQPMLSGCARAFNDGRPLVERQRRYRIMPSVARIT